VYSASRNTVRDAIKRLVSLGLVVEAGDTDPFGIRLYSRDR
jgi:hypothetical protein